jgi:DNA polymerase III subunit epsilon
VSDPAPTSAWDRPIAETPWAFVDLELTGLNPAVDHIIEVCIVRTEGASETRFSTLVRPPEGAFHKGGNTHVHGLTDASLASAPTFAEILPRIRALLDGAVFVAHGAKTDVLFLEAEAARTGAPLRILHHLDTLTLSRRAFHVESYSLSALCTHFSFAHVGSHRADGDVDALRALWAKLLAELKPQSARDLWEVRVSERKARTEILDACTLAMKRGAPVRITYRPSRKPAQTFDFVISSVQDVAPHVQGYFWPGRGRRDLRADRILKVEPIA